MAGCKPGQIRRSSYRRGSYERVDGTHVRGSKVKSTCIKDVGASGKTPASKKVLPKLEKGVLSKFGYKVSKSQKARRASLDNASEKLGRLRTLRHVNVIANYSKWNPEVEQKLRKDVKYLSKKHKQEKKASKKGSKKGSKRGSKK